VNLPQRGFLQALTRARIPYIFVNADDLERDAAGMRALILPNLCTMTDAQVASLRTFVRRGGGIVATGATSLFDEWGEARPDLALADELGVSFPASHPLRNGATRRQLATENTQSYLRLTPELRAKVYGPHVAGEPTAIGTRHPVLKGFDETDILPYGGSLTAIAVSASARVLLTFVPPRPAFPPEAVWSLKTTTDLAGLVVSEHAGAGRVAYLAADLDRRYARDNIGDTGNLLANLVRWVAQDDIPLSVEGPGLLDCHLYRQPGRVVLHVVNLTNEGTWRGPIDELIPVGPIRVAVRVPEEVRANHARLLVAGTGVTIANDGRWARFEVGSITDHEVAVIE